MNRYTGKHYFSIVGYAEERPWRPIQTPNKGRKGYEGKEMRSGLLILDLKKGNL